MPVVSDYTAILGYLDEPAFRWNATEDLGFPVFVSYSFYRAANLPGHADLAFPATTIKVMSTAQKNAVRAAMTQIEDTAGVIFVETSGEAMINAHAVTGSGYGGWANYPYVTDLTSSIGDYVIDVTRGEKLSGDGIGTLLHELGHALGLSHTHGGNLTLAHALDVRTQTIMSYNWASTPVSKLGPLDIEALQHIYGTPANTSGWSYGFSGDEFRVTGSGRDDRIMGVEGKNVLKGQGGDDYIVGRDGNDKLYGGKGNDTLLGMDGADRLFGGKGKDVLIASVQDDLNYSDPGLHKMFGGEGADTLLGGDGDDVMQGGAGKDVLTGGFGDDVLAGGKGLDILTGGSGSDVFRFAPATDGSRDKIMDFVYYSDSLDFTGISLDRDDITAKSRAGGANTQVTINDGAGVDYDILFKNTAVADVRAYLDWYHDFA